MKTILKFTLIVISIPVTLVISYFSWQFTFSQIHTNNCKNLNKNYTPKTYLDPKSNLKMQIDSLENSEISSIYKYLSGTFLYPGMEYGCKFATNDGFFYTLKFDNYEPLKIYHQSKPILELSYDQKIIDYDKLFERELEKNNWKFIPKKKNVYLESSVKQNIYLKNNSFVSVKSPIYIYQKEKSWSEFDLFLNKDSHSVLDSFFATNNLNFNFADLEFVDFDQDSNLIMNLLFSDKSDNSQTSKSKSIKMQIQKQNDKYILTKVSLLN